MKIKNPKMERLERAAKLVCAVMEGTVCNLGGMVYKRPNKLNAEGSYLMSFTQLHDAVKDVNQLLSEKGIAGRIERLDAGGTPEWGLVDK